MNDLMSVMRSFVKDSNEAIYEETHNLIDTDPTKHVLYKMNGKKKILMELEAELDRFDAEIRSQSNS